MSPWVLVVAVVLFAVFCDGRKRKRGIGSWRRRG